MVMKIIPVRAVDLSIGPFCTEFRCERFCDDDVFRGIDHRGREIDHGGREIDHWGGEIDHWAREIDHRAREIGWEMWGPGEM